MSKFTPLCHLKVDGKVLSKDEYKYWGYGWDNGGLPTITNDYTNLDNYICCICAVKDGKAKEMYYDSNVGRSCQRTAIGSFADGRLWIYADKTSKTPKQMQDIALKAELKDCLILDGGGSTQGIFQTGKVTSSRKVHNFICVWTNDNTAKSSDDTTKSSDASTKSSSKSSTSIKPSSKSSGSSTSSKSSTSSSSKDKNDKKDSDGELENKLLSKTQIKSSNKLNLKNLL